MNQEKKQKQEALKNIIKNLERDYGKGIIMKMGDNPKIGIGSFSSGSITLDKALGIGGFPKGRIIEIYGPESSGKTTIALHAIAEAQKEGGLAAFIDAEHALDIKYAKQIGVDIENLYISQPNNGEQALEIVDSLINSHAIDIIVVDSVAALVPKSEIEGNMGDAQMALQARLMSQALRKITGSLSKSQTSIIFINQLRMKVGVFFGNPETTTGGNALKFYSSLRLDIRKIETLKKGDEIYGSKVRIKIVKNKVAPPFKSAEIVIIYGEGISKTQEIIDLCVKENIIKKSGSWFSYQDERIGQGQESVKQFLKNNSSLLKDLEKMLRKLYEEKEVKNLENNEEKRSQKNVVGKQQKNTSKSNSVASTSSSSKNLKEVKDNDFF